MRLRLIVLCTAILASCAHPSSRHQRIGGLLRSDSQFVTSPDRCAISVLHDNYRMDLPRPPQIQNPSRLFTVAGGANLPATFDLRGTFDAPSNVQGSITLEIGGRSTTHQLAPDANGTFLVRYRDRLSASGETPIKVTAAMIGDVPSNQNALLTVQSIDVGIDRGRMSSC